MIKNMVGLEAEFILGGSEKGVVIAGKEGFETDEYPVLAEIRAEPGNTREDTLANFTRVYNKFLDKVREKELSILSIGWKRISPELHAEILKFMGTKVISDSNNIYNLDIHKLSDVEIKDGKIIGRKISAGLHIHFSSDQRVEKFYNLADHFTYSPVNIPLSLGTDNIPINMELYKRNGKIDGTERCIKAVASRITNPVIHHIVKSFDEQILPNYLPKDIQLKYRNPGFYELKGWGFEYRSLPASERVLQNLRKIVDFAFNCLEAL